MQTRLVTPLRRPVLRPGICVITGVLYPLVVRFDADVRALNVEGRIDGLD